jgi:cytochrome c oxidase subunit 2
MKTLTIAHALLIALVIPASVHAQATINEIKMTAKKYEFDPGQIKVKQGDHVRLVITALDHDHGFKLEAFQID